jgi:hypothetical protein
MRRLRSAATSAAVSRERAKLLAAQAERVRQRVLEASGDLISAAEVEKEWTGILRLVRARLLAVANGTPKRMPTFGAALAEARRLRRDTWA